MKNTTLKLFVFPSLCGVTILYCIPLLLALYYVLIENMGTKRFSGLKNFTDTAQNPMFQLGLRNTVVFILIAIPLVMVLSLLSASCIKRLSRGGTAILATILLPFVIPSGATAFFWKSIFSLGGLINKLLYQNGLQIISWQDSPLSILIPVIIFLWKNTGFITAILLAGLYRIPNEYYEIAFTEGIGRWKCFRKVTLVYLSPILFIAILLSVILSFKVFRELYMLFGSYPSPNIYLLQHFMNNQFLNINMQKLSSAAYILLLVIVVMIISMYYSQRRLSDTFESQNFFAQSRFLAKRGSGMVAVVLLVVSVAMAIVPVMFTAANSFMNPDEIISRYSTSVLPSNIQDLSRNGLHFVRMGLLPESPSLNQYIDFLFHHPAYLRLFWNSCIIFFPVLVGQAAVSILGAYAFERIRWRAKEAIFFGYIVFMLMPMQVLLVPHYIVFDFLGLVNTYWIIILPAIFNPIGVFLIRLQMKGFPKECIVASQLDGATEWQVLTRVVLPNMKASIASLVIFTMAEYWNVVDQAVVFIKSVYDEPLSVYLSRMIENNMGLSFAASCIYMILPILVFLICAMKLKYAVTQNK